MAYLPPNEIPEAFKRLKETVLPTDYTRIMEWIETNYVVRKPISRKADDTELMIERRTPLFAYE